MNRLHRLARVALALCGTVLASGGTGSPALAASGGATGALLAATEGVVGRAEVVGDGVLEEEARRLHALGAYEEAAGLWAAARHGDADPDTSWAWEVVNLVRAEDWELARLAALAALAEDPGDPERRLLFGWLMCQGGAERTARDVARGEWAAADRPGAAVLELRALRHAGRQRAVVRARARHLDAGVDDAWFWLESSISHFMAREPEALADLDRAVRAPRSRPVHFGTAVELRSAAGDHRQALELGLSGMARFPDAGELVLPTAMVAGTPEGAGWLQDVIDRAPDRGEARELRGAIRLTNGDPEGALVDLQAAADAGRRTAAVRGMTARALVALDRGVEALEQLAAATDEFPGHLGLAEERYALALDLDAGPAERLAAAEAWDRAVRRAGGVVPARVGRDAIGAAESLGRPAVALAWSERLLAQEPDAPLGLQARARALSSLARQGEGPAGAALAAWEAAHRREPADPAVLVGFAGFLLAPGDGVLPDPARARSLARRAVDLSPSVTALELLAAAAWALGDREEAVARQQDALQLAPEDPVLQRRLRVYTGEVR